LKISLILPVYNPAPEWADIVLAKSDELKNFYPDIEFETIVVNDGSVSSNFTEGKKKLISTSINLIEYHPNQGKGEAIRTGVRASAGDLIIYTDIDFPYTMDSMCLVIDTLRGGKQDIVIGIKDDSYYAHVPAIRRLISRFLRMLIRFFFRIPTDDTQCGLKGFNQKAKPVFLRTTIKRYLFDLEFIFIASRTAGIAIKTQPVRLCDNIEFRKMDFGIIRNELWNFFKIFFKTFV
jgi:glycosyltransferase involved in cell wall biosynthesis